MRKCGLCAVEKQISDFHKGMYRCKQCTAEVDRGRVRHKYAPESNRTDAARARKRRYQSRHGENERTRARSAVKRAIDSGELVVSKCEICNEFPKRSDGARAVQAHHEDYLKPLEVKWLCVRCHNDLHAAMEGSGDE